MKLPDSTKQFRHMLFYQTWKKVCIAHKQEPDFILLLFNQINLIEIYFSKEA